MVISGSEAQRVQLRKVWEDYRVSGKIVFGIHAALSALIICMATNYDSGHVHFLDGANGGYAIAVKELERQLTQS